jgi:hypothetical protein
MGMREYPYILCKADLIADGDSPLGIDKDSPVKKDKVTDINELSEVETKVLLRNKSDTAPLKEVFGNKSSDLDGKCCEKADRQLVERIPKEMKVTLLCSKGVFPSQRKEFAI